MLNNVFRKLYVPGDPGQINNKVLVFKQTIVIINLFSQTRNVTVAARPTIWLYILCRRYFIWIRYICLIYNNLFYFFLYKWSTRLQSMYNHMVGRAVSVVSPFYFLVLGIDKQDNLGNFNFCIFRCLCLQNINHHLSWRSKC